MKGVAMLLALIALTFVAGCLVERAIDKAASPCHMVCDDGTPLDDVDCAYMGGGGWE